MRFEWAEITSFPSLLGRGVDMPPKLGITESHPSGQNEWHKEGGRINTNQPITFLAWNFHKDTRGKVAFYSGVIKL